MAFLPPTTKHEYNGVLSAAWFLTFWSCGTIIPGLIHTFLPDGGAGVIAGLDLTQCGSRIIGLFAWAGATQIVWGIIMMVVSTRNRSFVPLLLALVLLERTIMALNMWLLKNTQGHHSPEAYATLAMLPLIAFFLVLSLRHRSPQ
ncbi:MAG: hypothetical protein KKF30_01020 [Proteobacteria bacterium]|nr:hypothetical protein [Pseudomonadota bacterium]MBU4470793.1 hypothetical protein [Pseudomonadota bacterium]MCG2751479.1 hypothetical protein [Desulfobacteraceae bacterium]